MKAKSLIAIAALLVSTTALADDYQNSRLFEQYKLQAQSCLRDSARAMPANASTAVMMSVVSTCNRPLDLFMTQTLGEPRKRVNAYLKALTMQTWGMEN